MIISENYIFRGRKFTLPEIELIRNLIKEDPNITRRKLSRMICELINWRQPNGILLAHVTNKQTGFYLGRTKGKGRSGRKYFVHGKPKDLYVYPFVRTNLLSPCVRSSSWLRPHFFTG
jgi:hypothetical protein